MNVIGLLFIGGDVGIAPYIVIGERLNAKL